MKRLAALVLAGTLLSGCEGLNEALVRRWYMDRGVSSEINTQIREGYERRMSQPPRPVPVRLAPDSLDQG